MLVKRQDVKQTKERCLGERRSPSMQIEEEEARWEPQDIALDIVYEDDDITVINKPRDLVVTRAPVTRTARCSTRCCIIIRRLPTYRAGIVHRLDKDTTGLMVVAKTVPAQTRLVESLQRVKSPVNTKRWRLVI
ncbi:pseudouridine synthase [Serratia ureilytica]